MISFGRVNSMNQTAVGIIIVADAADAADLVPWLRSHSDFSVLATIGRREGVIKKVESLKPDVVIIAGALPGFAWASTVNDLKQCDPMPGVVVISEVAGEADLLSAFRQGVDAFILKACWRAQLLPALKAVTTGGIYYHQKDASIIRAHLHDLEMGSARRVHSVRNSLSRLTIREKEVFPLLADGKSIKEVAQILRISPKTVESHKYNIMKKLDFENMTDWTKAAIVKEIIPL